MCYDIILNLKWRIGAENMRRLEDSFSTMIKRYGVYVNEKQRFDYFNVNMVRNLLPVVGIAYFEHPNTQHL